MGQAVLITSIQTAILSIIVYFINSWLNTKYQEKVEDYKTTLNLMLENHKLNLNTDLERFKSTLLLNVNKQGQLYQRRLDVIDNMHKLLVELDSYMRDMVGIQVSYEGENQEEKFDNKVKAAQKAIADFNNYVIYNAHYFTKEHAALLEKLRKDYKDANFDFFNLKRMMRFSGGEMSPEMRKEAGKVVNEGTKRIQNDLPKVISQIEDEFRRLLAVES